MGSDKIMRVEPDGNGFSAFNERDLRELPWPFHQGRTAKRHVSEDEESGSHQTPNLVVP